MVPSPSPHEQRSTTVPPEFFGVARSPVLFQT
jgi:hypothetical protein